MARTLELTTSIPAPPDTVWGHVRTSRLLDYVIHPLIKFQPKSARGFPDIWVEGDYRADMRLFGAIPMGEQTIGIRYPEGDGSGASEGAKRYVLRDDGHGSSARVWDHWIIIEPDGSGGTLYTDRVTVDAGWRTPFVAAFARAFYAHRQRRWQKLAQTGFADLH